MGKQIGHEQYVKQPGAKMMTDDDKDDSGKDKKHARFALAMKGLNHAANKK